MLLREKGKKDGEPVRMEWGQAQTALPSGAYEVVEESGERGPDQPAAQSPSPGTAPKSDEGKPEDDGLDDKTRAELDDIAKERGVDVSAARTKADVIAALRTPR